MRVLIFIVAYNASSHIAGVLTDIPESIFTDARYQTDILIIDDASPDNTFAIAKKFALTHNDLPITVLRNESNRGYGGNQKLGYEYAISHGYDIVALLHGDGQYNPVLLPRLLEPLIVGKADMVFGSRMICKRQALKGGMPLYKFVGNIILTSIQNKLLSTKFSEFHSGYRLYLVSALTHIPFKYNSDYFDFDTHIIIQLSDQHYRIHEESIPTFYGDEICHVNGLKYAIKIITSTLFSRLQKRGLYYHPRYDYSQLPRL